MMHRGLFFGLEVAELAVIMDLEDADHLVLRDERHEESGTRQTDFRTDFDQRAPPDIDCSGGALP